MSGLLHKVESFLNKISFVPNQSILLACSGGRDSMALALALQKLGLNFALAHCNFKLRGKESDLDEIFVKNWAEVNNVKIYFKSFDTRQYANNRKMSIQQAARELRYQFFNEVCTKEKFDYIATAHHLQDSLETFLINIGRGTGFKGLAGIAEVNENIIRLLSELGPEKINRFTQKHQLQWREDSSNAKDDYQRNTIRHNVIPELKAAIPGLEQKWRKTLSYLKQDWNFFEGQMTARIKGIVDIQNEYEVLSIPKLLQIKGYSSVLYHWLKTRGNFDLTAIQNCLFADSGKYFESKTHQLLKDRNQLILKKKVEKLISQTYDIDVNQSEICKPVFMNFVKKEACKSKLFTDSFIAVLDFEQLRFPLTLRKWQPGDRFYPLGLNSPKKLSDFFIDEKINRFTKEQVWLLCSNNEIVWVIGLRIDNRYRVTNNTKAVYFARLLKTSPL